jgi:hypothetical protein
LHKSKKTLQKIQFALLAKNGHFFTKTSGHPACRIHAGLTKLTTDQISFWGREKAGSFSHFSFWKNHTIRLLDV